MNSIKKNTKWAGIFYILATVAPILTIFFVGFLGGAIAGEPIPDYLARVSANELQVVIGMLIELLWALAVVGIIVTLFPILRTHNETLALGFFGLRFMEAISTMLHAILLLSLLTLSREYAGAGTPDASFYKATGTLFLAAREWTFMIGSGLVWSLSALLLNYQLYQGKLIPRWLSVWGFAGAVLSFASYFAQFFGIEPVDALFYPIAVQEMVFAVWLIVKGLSAPPTESTGTSTQS